MLKRDLRENVPPVLNFSQRGSFGLKSDLTPLLNYSTLYKYSILTLSEDILTKSVGSQAHI